MTTDSNEVDKNEEVNNEPTEQETEAKLAEEILAKQTDANKAIAEGKTELESTEDGDEEDKVNEDKVDEDAGEEIDETLVEAGRSLGMSDDEIINMATDNPKALEALADAVNKSDNSDASTSKEDETDDKTEVNTDKEDGDTDEDVDLESLDPAAKKVVETLMKKVKGLEEKVTKSNDAEKAQQEEAIQVAINKDFDEMTEAFPVLGSSDTMTQAQFKLRESVLDEALAINNLPSSKKAGMEWPDCMKQAATNLLGKPKEGSKSKSENKSVKPDKVKKLFTQKPTGRKQTADTSGEKTEAQLAEEIATIQNSIR